jgi:hypothetical protein
VIEFTHHNFIKEYMGQVKMNRRKLLWLISVCFLALSLILISCGKKQPVLSESDKANIYAAVIRQVYTIDHTFGSNPPNFPVVYLLRSTDDRAGDPSSSEANSIVLSQSLQMAIESALDDLPAEFIWVDNRNEVPMDKDAVAGNGAIIYFGNIYLQKDNSVQVATGLFFASLGGGGTTYIVELINGAWTVTSRTGKSWIS